MNRILVKAGANINIPCTTEAIKFHPIHIAALYNKPATLNTLLRLEPNMLYSKDTLGK